MTRQPLTPAQRSLRARIAANARIAKPGYDPKTAMSKAQAARLAKYEAQVDPEGKLTPEARADKVRLAMKVDMDRVRLKASRTVTAKNANKKEAA